MLSYEKSHRLRTKSISAIITFLILTFSIFPATLLAADHPCKKASTNLRGDLDVIGNRGGFWTLMEQTEGLSEKSVIGLQLDAKLARSVGKFEELCESDKKPTKELFTSITNLLGEARTIFNPQSSGEKILTLISNLSKKLDTLLANLK
jgi:hypothetical protein